MRTSLGWSQIPGGEVTFTTKLVHRSSHFIRFLWFLKPEKLAEKLEMRLFLIEVVARRERNFEPKERICLKNERRSTNQCDAQTEFFVHTGLQPCVGGGEVWCAVMWCDWLRDGVGCEVRWGNVVSWLRGEMRWCDVMGWDEMWCGWVWLELVANWA